MGREAEEPAKGTDGELCLEGSLHRHPGIPAFGCRPGHSGEVTSMAQLKQQ